MAEVDNANNNLMELKYTLHHHVLGINTITLSLEESPLTDDLTGDDANIVIWDILAVEKVQILEMPGLVLGFALSCADGSIHVYQCVESSSNYQYLTQEIVHDGPILDLKFNAQFDRLASVSSGFPQVSQLQPTDSGE
ncbi:hypothetical protein PILCRDRAFT_15861 [Piloderma croceum F 1598]|uniref:Uncharacterized protein n=1 Tax=Piloderma croceum (strain F 1598) TaxID=765440 RepID=A0A0C3EJD2_PILCF|nr:hypothetical protein PILCRDRAFT_15861 [Piloderma croceum F 1598]